MQRLKIIKLSITAFVDWSNACVYPGKQFIWWKGVSQDAHLTIYPGLEWFAPAPMQCLCWINLNLQVLCWCQRRHAHKHFSLPCVLTRKIENEKKERILHHLGVVIFITKNMLNENIEFRKSLSNLKYCGRHCLINGKFETLNKL